MDHSMGLDKIVNTTYSCRSDDDDGNERLMNDSAKLNYLIISIVFSTITIISLAFNLVFACIFYQNRTIWTSRTYILLLMLVISDLYACILVLPPLLYFLVSRSYSYQLCELAKLLQCLGLTSVLMSLVTVFVINIDLYVAIVKPYLYNKSVKIRFIVIVILLSWLFILISATVCMYIIPIWKAFSFIMAIVTIFLLSSMFYLHVRINKELSGMVSRERAGSITHSTKNMVRTHKRSAKLAFAMWGVIIIVYSPSLAMVVYRLISRPSAFVNTFVFSWIQSFSLSNVLWNPILYYFRMKSIRRRFFRILCRKSYNVKQKSKRGQSVKDLAFVHRNTSSRDIA